ncbi:MAG: PP2C family protein-serine/threonine phosphatase [bacterium]
MTFKEAESFRRKIDEILERGLAFYIILDAAEERAFYSNAGHPFPILIRRERSELIPLEDSNVFLGVYDGRRYRSTELPLRKEDAILLFTDGVFELSGPSGRRLGEEGFYEMVRANMDLPLEKMLDTLIAEVDTFGGGADKPDDINIVGVSYGEFRND